ncbi:hypothetical protein NW762_010553 [Fusarium torreyae]|uniref:Uncharacterized protein n=1 Tax=Fusarium torreyae TaxID=1237075 RepID=A0A9W8RT05_9HYPO|nr:hypothetical protein NW762_010553 [Fusarium torreyae]
MAVTVNILNLPVELREQIFQHYFKVDGGYIYNAESDKLLNADNSPVNLSLMYTCRSVAKETKNLPLAVNTIKFSTLYREDLRSLAGCFNLVSTFYHLLASDLVVRLAQFMTPDMYTQLGQEFPAFVPQLKEAVRSHEAQVAQDWAANFADDSDDESDGASTISPNPPEMVKWQSGQSWRFEVDNVADSMRFAHRYYGGFGRIDRSGVRGHVLRDRWDGCCWDISGAISFSLQLLAEKEPTEFATLVYERLPHWDGTIPAHQFLDMGFEHWAIPSQSEISVLVNRFKLNDAWKILDLWHHTPSRDCYTGSHSDEDAHYNSLPKPLGIRCREKIRFSAAAAAIRFLGRLPTDQRVQIRNLVLHEDLPSVNAASAHAQGLAPFFKENRLLRVERRVSILGCILGPAGSPSNAAATLQEQQRGDRKMLNDLFLGRLAHWLFDALAVTHVGIPANSFTFVLEAGPYRDYCTDVFQQLVHRDIAWYRAYNACLDRGFLEVPPGERTDMLNTYMIQQGFEEAIELLVDQTSILRSDFNPGFAWNFEPLVDETKELDALQWAQKWAYREPALYTDLPSSFKQEAVLADNFEIQTEDDYLQPERCTEHDDLPV